MVIGEWWWCADVHVRGGGGGMKETEIKGEVTVETRKELQLFLMRNVRNLARRSTIDVGADFIEPFLPNHLNWGFSLST